MVRGVARGAIKTFLFWSLLWLISSPAQALLPQTGRDLRLLEDRLRYEAERAAKNKTLFTPLLVATPQASTEESKSDFAPAVFEVAARVFKDSGELIACAECFQSRVYVSGDNRMVIQNGELGLSDLARLRENPAFQAAKSVMVVRETPAGIELRIIALADGRIIYTGLLDSTKNLDQIERPLRLVRESERRSRGESLSYFHFDLGLYPQGLVQMKWLEQWGSRNQHLSGFAIGAYNPAGAVGVTYLYMLPMNRRMTLGATAYYSLQGVFQSSGGADLASNVVAQASFNFAFSGAYGVFVAADSKGVLSAGFSLQNPVFLPFLF